MEKCAHEIENNTAPPPALNLADRGSSLIDPKSAGACDARLTQFSFFSRVGIYALDRGGRGAGLRLEWPGAVWLRGVIPAAVRVLFRGSGAQPFWGKGKEALCGCRCVDGLGELTAGGWVQFCSLSALGGQQQREVG